MDWVEENKIAWQAFVVELEAWQADRFPTVCMEICGHHCCDLKNTVLKAPREEIAVLLGFEPDDWTPYQTDEEGLYRFSAGDCPHYERETRRCKIWKDPRRPPICREFPFGLYHDKLYRDQKVYVSPACAFEFNVERWSELVDLGEKHGVDIIKLKAT